MGFLRRSARKPSSIPTLAQAMTPSPQTIRADATLRDAHNVMRRCDIRHLPVERNNQIVGLVSVHDLHLVETFPDVDPSQVPVEDAMSEEIFFASSTDGIDLVASTMAARKVGSTLVLDEDGKLVGIFTIIDALRVLAFLCGQLAR